MKKLLILMLSFFLLVLLFAGCSEIANIALPQDSSSSEIARDDNIIIWTGKGINSLASVCGEKGYINWALNQAKDVTSAELFLDGSGSESYLPVQITKGGVYQFTTPYYDLETLEAYVTYTGNIKKNTQLVIKEYCPGENGGGTATYNVTYDGNNNTVGTVPVDSTEYSEGDMVTVLGNTGSLEKIGYNFDGWNTAADSTGTPYAPGATFLMGTADITVYAYWTLNTYTLTMTVSPEGYGTATDVTPGDPGPDYPADFGVSISATANAGYEFVNWTAPAGTFTDSTSSSTYFSMPAQDVTVTANFQEVPPTIYTVTFGVYMGMTSRMSIVSGSISATDDGDEITSGDVVEAGSEVVFTAAPSDEYQVKDWYVDSVSQGKTDLTHTIDDLQAAVDVQVEFEEIPAITQYTLTISADTGGSVNSVSGDYDEGTVVGIIATPDTGYQFVDWTVDSGAAANVADTSSASTSVTMNEDMTLTANFEESTPPSYTP